MADLSEKKCTTPKFRASYVHVKSPQKQDDGSEKYGVTMLFDKKTDLSKLKEVVNVAIEEKYGSLKKMPKKFRMPFRDGDGENEKGEEFDPEYKGKIFVSAKCKEQPGVVDIAKEDLLDLSDFYSGCYARATVIAFVYENKGNVGASFALLNLQKLGDGKKIGGKKDAKDDFDAAEDESDVEANYESEGEEAEESEDDGGF